MCLARRSCFCLRIPHLQFYGGGSIQWGSLGSQFSVHLWVGWLPWSPSLPSTIIPAAAVSALSLLVQVSTCKPWCSSWGFHLQQTLSTLLKVPLIQLMASVAASTRWRRASCWKYSRVWESWKGAHRGTKLSSLRWVVG